MTQTLLQKIIEIILGKTFPLALELIHQLLGNRDLPILKNTPLRKPHETPPVVRGAFEADTSTAFAV